MAGANIAPRFQVEGIAHRVDAKTLSATDTLPARDVANVMILTDGGGFAELYIGPEDMAACPVAGQRVRYSCDVSIWNRKTQDGSRTYPVLMVRFVADLDAAAPPAVETWAPSVVAG